MQSRPELFDGAYIQNPAYDTRRLRDAEDFARICEDGPRDLERFQAWQACGVDYLPDDFEQQLFVRDHVYGRAERFRWDEPGLEVEVGEPWELPSFEGWEADDLAAGQDELVVLYDADGVSERLVARMDPTDGSVTSLTVLEVCPAYRSCGAHLARIEDEVVVVGSGRDGRWLVDVDGKREATLCPDGGRWIDGGWWTTTYGTTFTLSRCDAATGETWTAEPPEHTFPLWSQDQGTPALVRASDRPALYYDASGLLWLDEDETWHPVSLPWHLAIEELDHAGELLLARLEALGPDDLFRTVYTAVDPLTGELVAPADPCPLPMRTRNYNRETWVGDGWAVQWEGWMYRDPETLMWPLTWRT